MMRGFSAVDCGNELTNSIHVAMDTWAIKHARFAMLHFWLLLAVGIYVISSSVDSIR